MNSIFLRIYGGMVLVCLVIGLLFYISLEAINFIRLQYFRTNLVTGPVQLVAEMTLNQPYEFRQRWARDVGRLLDADMRLVTRDQLSLSGSEAEQLDDNEVVLRLTDAYNREGQAIVAVPEPTGTRYLIASGEYLTEQQGRGLAELVSQYLSRFPVTEWNSRLEAINKRFGFPVRRVAPFEVKLDDEKKHRLFHEEQAVVNFAGNRGESTSITAYKLLSETGEVLQLGPQNMFNWYPFELMAVMVVIALAMVGFAVYLFVKPLENRLSSLEKAVLRIRGGDLNARAPVEGSDAIGQLAGTLNGMTEHIQRLLNSQKELTRAVSHELRTPVARIRFGLEMLMDADNDEQRLRQVELIDQDIEQLDKLIDEILTYSKLEEGTPVLDFVMIDLDALMRRVEQESKALSGKIDVVYVAPDLPEERCFAEGEERYIHRVVQNLVGNALRYAHSRVEITFSAMGDVFRIDVHDDGPGIPESDRKRVFQPFTRLDDSRTRASGGYGLGLSIVNRIAYWHGGRVRVGESELGGAKFSFLWPRLQSLRESN
ncbi:MAG: two-component sensor histidine kinase [Pseudomonadales bacterium]|nr:two-component sensor histidine kinase [Pseudomonadales bacterium]